MLRRYWWVVPAAGLIMLALLMVGGYALYHMAWTSGYAAASADVAPPPYAYPTSPAGFSGFFWGPGLLVLICGLLLFGFVGKLFRLWMWRSMVQRRPSRSPWAWHSRQPHGHVPPWCWDWDECKAEDEGARPSPAGAEGQS